MGGYLISTIKVYKQKSEKPTSVSGDVAQSIAKDLGIDRDTVMISTASMWQLKRRSKQKAERITMTSRLFLFFFHG